METTKVDLRRQSAFYETLREDLEANSFGKWAVVANERLVGVYDSNREASEVALRLTGSGACLVRHIGYVVGVVGPMTRVDHVPVRDL